MTTEFSPPYHVSKPQPGSASSTPRVATKRSTRTRHEADDVCRLMNHNDELRTLTDEQITEAAKHAAIEQIRRELRDTPDSSGRYDDEDSHVEVRRLDEWLAAGYSLEEARSRSHDERFSK